MTFRKPVQGECVFCRKIRFVIPLRERFSTGEKGVCDGCSYACREEWNDLKSLRTKALTPEFSTTYLLLPKLLPERPELDLGSYQLVVVKEDLPSLVFSQPENLVVWLRETMHIITWPGVLKRIYAGFDSEAKFSEVVLVAAWGDDYNASKVSRELRTFPELLDKSTSSQAGFHLGLKGGFEMMLWRREMSPERTVLCTHLRATAMRYLGIVRGQDEDPEMPGEELAAAYWKGMLDEERLALRQLLSVLPPASEADEVRPVNPAVQAELPFADTVSVESDEDEEPETSVVDDSESAFVEAETSEEDEEETTTAEIRGPLEPRT
jgi:hypothetical protein